jgi:hypothetical protein
MVVHVELYSYNAIMAPNIHAIRPSTRAVRAATVSSILKDLQGSLHPHNNSSARCEGVVQFL